MWIRVIQWFSELLITSDGGGSYRYRTKLRIWDLQLLSEFICVPISVCNFYPVTSKWNKIEHRLLSFVTKNCGGRPLVDYETIVS
jgi:hypothetical protein